MWPSIEEKDESKEFVLVRLDERGAVFLQREVKAGFSFQNNL